MENKKVLYDLITKMKNDHFQRDHEVLGNLNWVVEHYDILIPFNWSDWREGREMLDNPSTDYSNLDTETLRKLLTLLVRRDRFIRGSLKKAYLNGIVLRILESLTRCLVRQ